MKRAKRQVEGKVCYARLCERPSMLPRAAMPARGVKAVGLRFERSVGKAITSLLSNVHLGQWIEWRDDSGVRYCQPDVYHVASDRVVVFECKLTEVEEARGQLLGLYLPLLRIVYSRATLGIVVARHLSKESDTSRVCDSLEGALLRARVGIPTLHWLGKGHL